MTAESTTIRVSFEQRERLRELADLRSASMAHTLDAALESLRREDFYRRMARTEADLSSDPDGWADYVRERDAWLEPDVSTP
ncbi:MAG: hypothetical protein WA991_08905 [Ornithinimicrobium sp.]